MKYNEMITLKRWVKHSTGNSVRRYVQVGLLLFLGSMQGSLLHAGDGLKTDFSLKRQADGREVEFFSNEAKETESVSSPNAKQEDGSYQSLFIRVGLGSWSEKAGSTSQPLSSRIFLRGDYAYMWDWAPGFGAGLFYVYSSNHFNAKYSVDNYYYYNNYETDCKVRVHYLGPQILYQTDRKRFSLKLSAGVGGALYVGLLSKESSQSENHSKPSKDKYGWVYSLSAGVEIKLSRDISLSTEYNFMNSFFSYKGYGKISDGTAKLYHHIGWLGIGYYF